MSDSENTPQGTARINSERFETQLATVWFAANYYYEASYRHGREYIGVVFHVPNEPDSEKNMVSPSVAMELVSKRKSGLAMCHMEQFRLRYGTLTSH
jgi:hypothetical protein